MSKVTVAVLRGGPSHEYDVSLKTGRHVLSLLGEMPDAYEPHDIFISRSGEWHRGGIAHNPEDALLGVDVVWNALHGSYGEDGQVQSLLEELGIPFTGSYSQASALAMDKERAKKVFTEHGFLVPRHELVEGRPTQEQLLYIFRNYLHPVIIKPVDGGSSIGTKIAHTFHELGEAIQHGLEHSKRVLVEEFIRGKEATCGVVENARGQQLYALLPVEIRQSKPLGESYAMCPGNFGTKISREIEESAKRAHQALGLEHYSRSDFIITPNGKIYILETNSLPGLAEDSLFPKALHAIGWHPRSFVDHIIGLAKGRNS